MKNNKLQASDKNRRCKILLSPLRYPGGKRRLVPIIRTLMQQNGIKPELFIEPFAGGASVALQLLIENSVDKIALIDRDPLISSFWKTVFYDSEWLIDQIKTIQIDMENWHFFKNNHFRKIREKALACIFLNRTSFSGIMASNAGPIGGLNQLSDYSLDCRFPRKKIIKRIMAAANLSNRVEFISGDSWEKAFKKISFKQNQKNWQEIFIYCDPPFYKKADKLYRYYFETNDHLLLKKALLRQNSNWLLSYDYADEIIEIYNNTNVSKLTINTIHTAASRNGRGRASEILITNLSAKEMLVKHSKKSNGCYISKIGELAA